MYSICVYAFFEYAYICMYRYIELFCEFKCVFIINFKWQTVLICIYYCIVTNGYSNIMIVLMMIHLGFSNI